MPKIEIAAVPAREGVGYPAPFASLSAHRLRQKLGEAGGISQFGVNLTRLPAGERSSQRHWHPREDELVFVSRERWCWWKTAVRRFCAPVTQRPFRGRLATVATWSTVPIGTRLPGDWGRDPDDVITCSDIDIMSPSCDGRFLA